MESKILDSFSDWLDGYLNLETSREKASKDVFWLDTMEFLCNKFNHPEIFAPCIHVAGSKGKGSVCAFISSILDADKNSVGLYTSPHIVDFTERVANAHGFFPQNVYETAANELREKIESISPNDFPGGRGLTWFELVTMFAFLTFRRAKVNWSVFEVGLGGRLDATNVVTPKVSVITPLELEHTEFLGDTIEKIAAEKGGIIKKNVPVVSAVQCEEAKNVLRQIAKEKNAPIYFVDECIDVKKIKHKYENSFMSISFGGQSFSQKIKSKIRLLGKLQAENAALAALAVKIALPKISNKTIEVGLSAAFLPARFELISAEKLGTPIILDGAHTINSAKSTVETFQEIFGKDGVLLFACAADKKVRSIAPIFADFGKVFLTRPGDAKKSDLGESQMAFSLAGIDFTAERNFRKAFQDALDFAVSNKKPLLVTGSFYLVAEFRQMFKI